MENPGLKRRIEVDPASGNIRIYEPQFIKVTFRRLSEDTNPIMSAPQTTDGGYGVPPEPATLTEDVEVGPPLAGGSVTPPISATNGAPAISGKGISSQPELQAPGEIHTSAVDSKTAAQRYDYGSCPVCDAEVNEVCTNTKLGPNYGKPMSRPHPEREKVPLSKKLSLFSLANFIQLYRTGALSDEELEQIRQQNEEARRWLDEEAEHAGRGWEHERRHYEQNPGLRGFEQQHHYENPLIRSHPEAQARGSQPAPDAGPGPQENTHVFSIPEMYRDDRPIELHITHSGYNNADGMGMRPAYHFRWMYGGQPMHEGTVHGPVYAEPDEHEMARVVSDFASNDAERLAHDPEAEDEDNRDLRPHVNTPYHHFLQAEGERLGMAGLDDEEGDSPFAPSLIRHQAAYTSGYGETMLPGAGRQHLAPASPTPEDPGQQMVEEQNAAARQRRIDTQKQVGGGEKENPAYNEAQKRIQEALLRRRAHPLHQGAWDTNPAAHEFKPFSDVGRYSYVQRQGVLETRQVIPEDNLRYFHDTDFMPEIIGSGTFQPMFQLKDLHDQEPTEEEGDDWDSPSINRFNGKPMCETCYLHDNVHGILSGSSHEDVARSSKVPNHPFKLMEPGQRFSAFDEDRDQWLYDLEDPEYFWNDPAPSLYGETAQPMFKQYMDHPRYHPDQFDEEGFLLPGHMQSQKSTHTEAPSWDRTAAESKDEQQQEEDPRDQLLNLINSLPLVPMTPEDRPWTRPTTQQRSALEEHGFERLGDRGSPFWVKSEGNNDHYIAPSREEPRGGYWETSIGPRDHWAEGTLEPVEPTMHTSFENALRRVTDPYGWHKENAADQDADVWNHGKQVPGQTRDFDAHLRDQVTQPPDRRPSHFDLMSPDHEVFRPKNPGLHSLNAVPTLHRTADTWDMLDDRPADLHLSDFYRQHGLEVSHHADPEMNLIRVSPPWSREAPSSGNPSHRALMSIHPEHYVPHDRTDDTADPDARGVGEDIAVGSMQEPEDEPCSTCWVHGDALIPKVEHDDEEVGHPWRGFENPESISRFGSAKVAETDDEFWARQPDVVTTRPWTYLSPDSMSQDYMDDEEDPEDDVPDGMSMRDHARLLNSGVYEWDGDHRYPKYSHIIPRTITDSDGNQAYANEGHVIEHNTNHPGPALPTEDNPEPHVLEYPWTHTYQPAGHTDDEGFVKGYNNLDRAMQAANHLSLWGPHHPRSAELLSGYQRVGDEAPYHPSMIDQNYGQGRP